jgi:haloalkane dehalogenase
VKYPERVSRLVIMNTAAFPPPANKKLPFRLRMIREFRKFARPAVLGLNLFAHAAIYMAPQKKLSKTVRQGLLAPYNSWHNRIATLKFVQDIPLTPTDPGHDIVVETEGRLHLLSHIPMLILWGAHDFVFDMDYLRQWQNHYPSANVFVFQNAGHYLLEDVPDQALEKINIFLSTHPLSG